MPVEMKWDRDGDDGRWKFDHVGDGWGRKALPQSASYYRGTDESAALFVKRRVDGPFHLGFLRPRLASSPFPSI